MEINFPKTEQKILKFWKERRIFEKSIKQRGRARDFIFYEGPPTANAKAGLHHVLARVYKDIVCRYKTMQGFRVLRKAGWDTHGLPVELEIEKKLGLKSKKDIEKYGISRFNKKCKESVWLYKQDWEKLTERIAFWLDMEHPYVTYEPDYMESLWQTIKQIHQKGLLYQDYKVVPYCPRCGTSLSSHEVALGYKKIKEPSIYIKFKIKNSRLPAPRAQASGGQAKLKNSYLLVWTTTPWTLPGNVAVAVNPKFVYVKAKIGNETFILAKERLNILGKKYKITEEFKGKDLLGLKYEPLYAEVEPRVISGDFVSLDEGTGLVHIAPAFGEDDMQVAKKNRLPIILNVDEEGKFKKEVPAQGGSASGGKKWAGIFVKKADPLIIKDLEKRNLLYKEELYAHDYPFCWRCDSPLLYYAKESWFINMQRVKKDLIANNQKINWIPSHLKQGRFGEWLKELKDWAFSRERYWGTPLPVWQCQKCHHQQVIGSKKDLLSQKFTDNNYYILRHGHSLRNEDKIVSCWPEKIKCPLTKKGEKEIKKAAQELKKKKIDLIFSSDLLRTKQTAETVAKETGAKIIFDKRLREVDVGVYNGRPLKFAQKAWGEPWGRFEKRLPKGESYNDVKKRVYDFLKDINAKYQGKNILVVSHECSISLLECALKGFSRQEIIRYRGREAIETGEWRKIEFSSLPYNENMELDFHRPYVDEVRFKCPKCSNGLMARAPELIDVWFDSGSMPFASTSQFPADFICEAVDQTRGWFYTLLAVSTLLGRGTSYKNVISLGHVLDAKGEKMSKSKGNVVDPWYIVEKYGADAVRWYFFTVNQPGDVKFFSEKDIDQALKKFILTFWNSYVFYKTYQDKKPVRHLVSNNVLDRWIISRLNELIQQMTEKLDKYDVTSAARAIEKFVINDLSLWYIRRSRKRFKEASTTLYQVLLTLSRLTAPFVPFLSEEIWQKLIEAKPRSTRSSVHLADWPKADKRLIDEKLNQKMEKVREIVSLALAERAKAGIRVRQPLPELKIKEKIDRVLLELIKEEINVKKIALGKSFKLEIKITQALKEEGIVREVIRQIQEMRKKAGCKPQDKVSVQYFGTKELNKILTKNKPLILKETKAKDFQLKEKLKKVFDIETETKVDQQKLWLGIKKL